MCYPGGCSTETVGSIFKFNYLLCQVDAFMQDGHTTPVFFHVIQIKLQPSIYKLSHQLMQVVLLS